MITVVAGLWDLRRYGAASANQTLNRHIARESSVSPRGALGEFLQERLAFSSPAGRVNE